MEWAWLKTYAGSLRDYHLHPEGKFRGGDFSDRGYTTRRHVTPFIVRCIGKEADNLDEREALGDSEEDAVEWPFFAGNVQKLLEPIRAVLDQGIASQRDLIDRAGVTRTTLIAALDGKAVSIQALLNLAESADAIADEDARAYSEDQARLTLLRRARDDAGGRDKLAALLKMTGPHLGRILSGQRPITSEIFGKLVMLIASE